MGVELLLKLCLLRFSTQLTTKLIPSLRDVEAKRMSELLSDYAKYKLFPTSEMKNFEVMRMR